MPLDSSTHLNDSSSACVHCNSTPSVAYATSNLAGANARREARELHVRIMLRGAQLEQTTIRGPARLPDPLAKLAGYEISH